MAVTLRVCRSAANDWFRWRHSTNAVDLKQADGGAGLSETVFLNPRLPDQPIVLAAKRSLLLHRRVAIA